MYIPTGPPEVRYDNYKMKGLTLLFDIILFVECYAILPVYGSPYLNAGMRTQYLLYNQTTLNKSLNYSLEGCGGCKC